MTWTKTILVEGDNNKPFPVVGQGVSVRYKMFLKDDSETLIDEKKGFFPYIVDLGRGKVIKAWEEAILTMREGEKAELIIGSESAYGDTGNGVVPGGAVLRCELEIVQIMRVRAPRERTLSFV